MKRLLPVLAATALVFTAPARANHAPAPAPFKGPDLSGVYDCQGDDSHEGKYSGTVTIAINKGQSTGDYAGYSFKLEVPGYGTYLGQAASRGLHMGIHFALTDPAPKDYGTGIATFRKGKKGKWTFEKYYYEPEFKGGNYGIESCVQR